MSDASVRDRVHAALPDLLEELPELVVERDVVLAKRTTFGIGGPADVIVNPRNEEELIAILRWCRDRALPWMILGGGSNVLIADKGIRGVLIALKGELAEIAVRDEGREILVGAGAKFPQLTKTALNLGWHSAVGWMGTPGQVGGALIMNAGTRDGEIGDVVIEVFAATADGALRISKESAGLSYRKSNFPSGAVLTKALLRCDSRQTFEADALNARAKNLLSRRHATQPKQRSAGSIFKNPPGDFAGRLIEAAGLKGEREGQAMISDVHANFIVNLGGARAADVIVLATRAQVRVKKLFNVDLEWEVKRIGDFT